MTHRIARYVALLLFLIIASGITNVALAQVNYKVQWKLLTPAVTVGRGGKAIVKVKAFIAPGSHIFSAKQYSDSMAPQPTVIDVGDSSLLSLSGALRASRPPQRFKDPSFDSLETEYWEDSIVFSIPVVISREAPVGKNTGYVSFYFQTCSDRSCMPPTLMKIPITVNIRKPG